MAQQTAVEWLIEQISEKQPNGFYVIDTLEDVKRVFEQAKQMEKEQIMKSFESSRIPYKYDANLTLNGFEDAEQYYNETFGKQ